MKVRKMTYVQVMHCCGTSDDEAFAELELHDGGGGEYLVLDAKQWAFNDEAEVDEFATAMKQLLATAEK